MNSSESALAAALRTITDQPTLVRFLRDHLGYHAQPVPFDPAELGIPDSPARVVREVEQLYDARREFQVYHMAVASLRRTELRKLIEPVIRKQPQPNYLFIFTQEDYHELAFVSPLRVLADDDPANIKLHLRILRVDRTRPYHTDLETLERIRIQPHEDAARIWQKHREAFSVERVTGAFFKDYETCF